MEKYDYDFIIAGAGCAGLSLAVHLIRSGFFSDKRILIVDGDAKDKNDRTWCFWEKGDGFFEPIVHNKWREVAVADHNRTVPLEMAGYAYKLIRGIDFYEYCFRLIDESPNFSRITGFVDKIESDGAPTIAIDGQTYCAHYIFNSILQKPELGRNQYWMLQHFRGWCVRTASPAFNPGKAILMDFRTHQRDDTAFFYVLPFSNSEALIEYTLFSNNLLEEHQYEDALREYVGKYITGTYDILERESGVIPMTNAHFAKSMGSVVNIGTAGGQTKGSSGYTFQFIQKDSAAIVSRLQKGLHPGSKASSFSRFRFYDSVLLDVLQHRSVPGSKIFMTMFKRNSAAKVLRFLDNDSSPADEVGIISKLPVLPFLKAAIRQLLSR